MFLSEQSKGFTKAGGNKECSFQLIRNVFFVPEIHNYPFIEFYSFFVFSAFYCLCFTGEVIEGIHSQWQGRHKLKSLDPLSKHWKHYSSLCFTGQGTQDWKTGFSRMTWVILCCLMPSGKHILSWLFWLWQRKNESHFSAGYQAAHWYSFGCPSEKRQAWYLNGVCSKKRLVWFVLWD